ncbi:hypothetical protein [Parathalassolituus penaei]|uniref:PilZ domain-containing protein n=1 Tax=Parathalassolituus penaei TaxID=2997323 RepID=A0A9X3IT79_9GAMM|nr:hypothetical protein [Parathalassolituus penaei]MCY0967207.1 hypothetical protein [Parathalassolituus penaei]
MTTGFVERRRYFRLDDQLLLAFMPIEASKAEVKPLTRDEAMERMEIEIDSLLSQLRSREPATARLLELLNQKINQFSSHQRLDLKDMPEQVLTHVNLSACGIRFLTHNNLADQTHLRLHITLLPSNTPLCLIARIVAVEHNPLSAENPDTEPWLIRATFEPILESDEEQLIHHMLRLQSRQLAARLHEQD